MALRQVQNSRLPDRAGISSQQNGSTSGIGISLDKVLNRIHALPALSPVVLRALQLTDREFISAREIVGVISVDAKFSARIVKAANTPCYALPRPANSVGEAVLLLGTDAFREVVLIAAARDIFYRDLPGYGVSGAEMWSHSLACGMAAQIVAELTAYSNPQEAFVSGLLHDVGKIILNEEMQTAIAIIRAQMARADCAFIDAERAILGYDHCDIGGRIARSWGLPQHIVQAVALHRKPIVSRQTVPLAGFVHLGEALCCSAGIGLGYEGLDFALETQVLADFKFTEEMADAAVSRLVDKMSTSQTLLAGPQS
jgi:putative nucleotidyltransferase with HDIG domain